MSRRVPAAKLTEAVSGGVAEAQPGESMEAAHQIAADDKSGRRVKVSGEAIKETVAEEEVSRGVSRRATAIRLTDRKNICEKEEHRGNRNSGSRKSSRSREDRMEIAVMDGRCNLERVPAGWSARPNDIEGPQSQTHPHAHRPRSLSEGAELQTGAAKKMRRELDEAGKSWEHVAAVSETDGRCSLERVPAGRLARPTVVEGPRLQSHPNVPRQRCLSEGIRSLEGTAKIMRSEQVAASRSNEQDAAAKSPSRRGGDANSLRAGWRSNNPHQILRPQGIICPAYSPPTGHATLGFSIQLHRYLLEQSGRQDIPPPMSVESSSNSVDKESASHTLHISSDECQSRSHVIPSARSRSPACRTQFNANPVCLCLCLCLCMCMCVCVSRFGALSSSISAFAVVVFASFFFAHMSLVCCQFHACVVATCA